jgi:ABC-type antimicrobial peptide transport system permease subunit
VHELARARRDTLAQPRSSALLLGLFAVAATLVAGLGLYALLRYQVVARHRELSVRVALGATRNAVVRKIVTEALALVGVGIAAGGLLAAGTVRFVAGSLHGVSPADPWALAAALAVLPVVAAIAAWLPARRASRVDPAELLR